MSNPLKYSLEHLTLELGAEVPNQEVLKAVTRLNRLIMELEAIGAWGLAKVLRAETEALLRLLKSGGVDETEN